MQPIVATNYAAGAVTKLKYAKKNTIVNAYLNTVANWIAKLAQDEKLYTNVYRNHSKKIS